MGRRRNKKKTGNEAFAPAPCSNASMQEQAKVVTLPYVRDEDVDTTRGLQYWTGNDGASTNVNQGVYSNMGTAHFSVASPHDIAVPPEHVNPMGIPPPGFNPPMPPVFMPSYGYPMMQEFGGYQPMSGAVFGETSYPACPFMTAGSPAMGTHDFQAGHASEEVLGGGALYAAPMVAESGAASVSDSAIGTTQGNVAGAVNEAMMEDPAIIVAQEGQSPKEINKIKELASQATEDGQELQKMETAIPNDCWADQVEGEMVELELQMEAKKLQQRSQAEQAEASYIKQSNRSKNGKPSTVANAAKKSAPAEGPNECKEVAKEMQQEAEKLQAGASVEKAEVAFVQSGFEVDAHNSAAKVEKNVALELAAETKKLEEKISAEQAEVAFMEAMNGEQAQNTSEPNNSAVVQELKCEAMKAQELATAQKAEAEFIAKTTDAQINSQTEQVAILEDMAELGRKAESLNDVKSAQAEHHAQNAPKKEIGKPEKDREGEKHINEALKAEGEKSQILMNAAHCEAAYFERESQKINEKSKEEISSPDLQAIKAERKSASPTEKKGMSWASVVADTTKETKEIENRSSPDVEPAREQGTPKEKSIEKTPPRVTPDKVVPKKETTPPKKVEAETPTDAAPSSVSPFVDEEGFVEPRQARRNRRRKTSRRSESENTDDEKTAQTPDEAAPASSSTGSETSPSSGRANTRDENGNQLTGHRMNIIETDEVSTQTDSKKKVVTSTIESQTEANAKKEPSTEDKAKSAELIQEKSQRMAGEGIIKVLEAETEQLRKQLASLQQQHVLMENDYIIVKGDLTEERRLAKEYKSRCNELEHALESKRNEVITMQSQLQQRETWIGGTDYMLELKEAKKKSNEADAAISAMQNQLKQSQNEVKKLQDQLRSAQDKQNEMIPMDKHVALLQKAEEKAMETEMKVLQLQTELLALQNSQEARNVQVEKQGQSWASVAAQPSAQTKMPGEKQVEGPAPNNPETSGEESDLSSLAEGEVANFPSAATGVSPTQPQTTGSKKEAKNASNNSKGGNKGKSRERPSLPPKPNQKPCSKPRPAVPPKPVWHHHPSPLDNKHTEILARIELPTCFDKEVEAPSLSVLHKPRGPPNRRKPSKFQKLENEVNEEPQNCEEMAVQGKYFQMASIPPIDYSGGFIGHTVSKRVFSSAVSPPKVGAQNRRKRKWDGGDGYGLTDEEEVLTREIDPQLINGVCEIEEEEEDEKYGGEAESFREKLDKLCKQLMSDLDDQDEFEDAEDDSEDEGTAFVDAEYDDESDEERNESESEAEKETEKESETEWEDAGDLQNIGHRSNRDSGYLGDDLEIFEYCLEDIEDGLRESSEEKEYCEVCEIAEEKNGGSHKVSILKKDKYSDDDDVNIDDDENEQDESDDNWEDKYDFQDPKGNDERSVKKIQKDEENKCETSNLVPKEAIKPSPHEDSDSDDDFCPENIFADDASDDEDTQNTPTETKYTKQESEVVISQSDIANIVSTEVEALPRKDANDEENESDWEEEEDAEEEDSMPDLCADTDEKDAEVKVFPKGLLNKLCRIDKEVEDVDDTDSAAEDDDEELCDQLEDDDQSSFCRDYAFLFISIIIAAIAMAIALMLSSPDVPVHLEMTSPEFDPSHDLEYQDTEELNLNITNS